ncbi:MAG: hypothetical protein WCJ14_08995 [Verrucomicrobiota bacterium]
MHLYRQPIILFGIVLPVLIATAIIGGGYLLKSQMVTSFDNKQKTYKTYEQGRLAGLEIESQITRQRHHLDRWNEQLSQETASAVATNLRKIAEHLPGKEIQQTAFERPNATGGFGSAAAQKSSQLRIAFRGTYRTLQRTFLELETRMPQLQLQDFQISPYSTQSSLLNFQVTYTAWEN